MDEIFAWNYHGAPFELFGPAHMAGLLALLALNLYLTRFRSASVRTKSQLRWILALTLWGNEIAWHVWKAIHGAWTIQSMLPLQICSLMVWFSGLMLVTRSYKMFEFSYFLGIGGALQALATPDLGIYGFPHFRFFQTFLSHGLIITAAIYMTVVEGCRPTWKSMLRAALWMNAYMLGIYFFNDAIGSNYLMLNGKPDVPSLLDFLPQWPWYIAWMEIIGIVTFLGLYLPFILKDRGNNSLKKVHK
jgi:hypothetical integral membrane protein (TIGR02206 family)